MAQGGGVGECACVCDRLSSPQQQEREQQSEKQVGRARRSLLDGRAAPS